MKNLYPENRVNKSIQIVPAQRGPSGNTNCMNRRHFVKSAVGVTAGLASSQLLQPSHADDGVVHPLSAKDLSAPGMRKRAIRVAHMTDVHIQPERGADKGFAKALRQVQGMEDPPTLIINGGDAIMCSFSSLEWRAKLEWDLWKSVVGDECGLPMLHCIGNHDIWGWDRHSSRTTGDEPLWGKGWAIDALRIPNRYYSETHAGWHFILLDSVRHYGDPLGSALTAHIDEEQWDWLEKDLAAHADLPTLIVTHMPIATVTGFFEGKRYSAASDLWTLPGGWMHTDAVKFRDLFRKHRQVKLCLSGHMHQVDEVYFDQVAYCCSGAISGDWWKGPFHGFDPGYALVDLYEDGTFAFQYQTYGWTPSS